MSYELLTIEQTSERVGLCASWIYALMDRGDFPRQEIIGTRCVRWRSDLIDAWLRERDPAAIKHVLHD